MSGKYVKVPIPEGNESTYVKVFREQSRELALRDLEEVCRELAAAEEELKNQ